MSPQAVGCKRQRTVCKSITNSSMRNTKSIAHIFPDPAAFKEQGMNRMTDILDKATLNIGNELAALPAHTGGKEGLHTEYLGFLLAEMQFLQRAYPGNEW